MNLPDYFRSELDKCQNINDITKLVAVVKHLAILHSIKLGYSERTAAKYFNVSNTRIGQIKRNNTLPGGEIINE